MSTELAPGMSGDREVGARGLSILSVRDSRMSSSNLGDTFAQLTTGWNYEDVCLRMSGFSIGAKASRPNTSKSLVTHNMSANPMLVRCGGLRMIGAIRPGAKCST